MNRRKEFCVTLILFAALLLSTSGVYAIEQYKNQTRNAISQIVDGKLDDAIKRMEKYLEKEPGDLESLYGLAVAHSQKKDVDTAMSFVERSVAEGLPFGRFLAGPRDLLKPLTDSRKFKTFARKQDVKLIHGPMLGCVTDSSAKFWVRTAREMSVTVSINNAGPEEKFSTQAKGKTSSEEDFTAVLAVDGLKPDSVYNYELTVRGDEKPIEGRFRTFPVSGKPAKFQVGFGGGAGYTPQYERMWNTIASHNLMAFLFLGDNVYIDHPTKRAVQQYCYYRRQSRPEYRSFIAKTCVFAIWDDHDFTTNDGWGGPEIREPEWKIPVWHTFMNNWNNPYYAGGEKQPGCWYDFSIDDVDFFMLDGRYYRTKPKSENPSMLGDAQKKWLFDKLKASKGIFKVLASPVPWAFGVKPGSSDPWQGYKEEREEIFSFLEANKIDGVILISADRHRSEARTIERENGYTLYEFESSRLTTIHTHGLIPGAIFGYNKKCSFGLLKFDTTAPDQKLTYEIINIDNELIHTLTLKKSQLSHTKAK